MKKWIALAGLVALFAIGVLTWEIWVDEQHTFFPFGGESLPVIVKSASSDDLSGARKALVSYFDLLSAKNYTEAKAYHGSGYEILRQWNPDVDPNDHETLLKQGCEENGWVCSSIKNIVGQKQISPSEFEFVVQFDNPLGSTFTFRVVKIETLFVVTTAPVYTP